MSNFMKHYREKGVKASPVNIARVIRLDDSTIKVIAYTGSAKINADMVESANSSFFNDDLRVLPGSSFRVTDDTIAYLASINNRSRPFEDSASMKQTTANFYLDDDNGIWTVAEDGGRKCLVRQMTENMDEIVESRRNNMLTMAGIVTMPVGKNFDLGNSVMFYDVADEAPRFGVAVSTTHVFCPDKNSIMTVANEQVQSVYRDNRSGVLSEAGVTGEKYLEYLRKLYQENSPYYQRIADLLANKTGL